ncbi:unnamed protein product [Bursaphelenchus xylophilus]|uniref:(pine wood nematode) hypothetical protein n=1 Tax=Bursaphelenchus xylophilus TaxID=6326 RepID=A0A7I8WM07_BURXY|nr:unnamed protein product [Bursaphelenchus xylophilus]CAG9104764.1 unnamed protein product [Bursaphelenchus xylophilus]
MTNPLIVSLFFAVLFGEVLSQSSSAKVLENLKKRYPERRFENIIDGDFRRYLAIARVNGSSAYHIGVVEAGQKFSEIAVEAGIATGAFAVFLLPQKNADGKFTEFFEPLGSRKALRRFNLSGNVCDFPYNYTQNGYRHIYSIGSHVRYGAKEVVNVGGLKCGDVLQSKDIATLPNSTLTPSVQRLLNRCWTSKGDETCVRDEGGNGTVLVNRYHPILHLNGITVYSHCCRNKICGKIPDRCAYFVYDQASGVDFYIDDQLNWTADAKKDPLVLIPLISGDDEFVKKRRYSFFPANPAQSPAPVPIPAPLNCSSGFNFNFGAFLGKFPKFSFGNFSFFNFSRFPFLKIGPRNMKGLQGLNGLGNLANLSSLVKH